MIKGGGGGGSGVPSLDMVLALVTEEGCDVLKQLPC